MDKFAIMPFTAHGRRLICPINVLDELIVKSADVPTMLASLQQTEALMRGRRALKPQQANNFHLQTAEEALEGWNKISGFLMTFLPVLVAISLVVGGMVIMNMMLIAVSQRAREIGLRRAMGARASDITWQFLFESLFVALVGGFVGVVVGIAGASALAAAGLASSQVTWLPFAIALAACTVIGLAFGVFPARKAARIDPVQSLQGRMT